MAERLAYVCDECGGSDVLLDAWAEWNMDRQDWILHDILTSSFYRRCDSETRLIEVVLADLAQ